MRKLKLIGGAVLAAIGIFAVSIISRIFSKKSRKKHRKKRK